MNIIYIYVVYNSIYIKFLTHLFMKFHLPTQDQLTQEMQGILAYTWNSLTIGTPGTGKTVVALHQYNKLQQKWKKVLILCYNKLLSELLWWKAKTINSFWWSIQSKHNNDSNIEIKYFSSSEEEEIERLFSRYSWSKWKYDTIIIDEWQDLPAKFYKHIHLISDTVHIYMDDNQQLSSTWVSADDILDILPDTRKFSLTRNFRNTKQIYDTARRFVPQDKMANNTLLISACPDIETSTPIENPNQTREEQYAYVAKIFQNFPSKSIWVFVPEPDQVEDFSRDIQSQKIKHIAYHGKTYLDQLDHKHLITTYKCCKWMEFDIVLLVLNEASKKEYMNNLLYVLCTRAKEQLHILQEKQ